MLRSPDRDPIHDLIDKEETPSPFGLKIRGMGKFPFRQRKSLPFILDFKD